MKKNRKFEKNTGQILKIVYNSLVNLNYEIKSEVLIKCQKKNL